MRGEKWLCHPGSLASPSRELSEQLINFVKQHLPGHKYPREVEFIGRVPKTPSGKIQSLLLKQRAPDSNHV
ncbi:MAG: AMP-binding enzyme [Syntrophobacteraceae bacterium]